MGRGSRSASWAQTLRARQREIFMWWGGVGAAHRLLSLGGTVGFLVAPGLPSQGESQHGQVWGLQEPRPGWDQGLSVGRS